MQIRRRTAVLLSVVAALMLVAMPLAQERAQAPDPASPVPIQGDIVRVDADAKLLVVKPAEGADVEFTYNDATEIVGAQEGAAGLATMKAGKVTVHYTEAGEKKVKTATKIEIQPAK